MLLCEKRVHKEIDCRLKKLEQRLKEKKKSKGGESESDDSVHMLNYEFCDSSDSEEDECHDSLAIF